MLLTLISVHAQQRYLDQIFSEVQRTDSVVYANNLSVFTGTPTPLDLVMDIYEPVGDTVSKRPIVIIEGSGNFLPRILNGGPIGEIRDSVLVELCTRFAKMGYVAASVFYRKGWDAQNTDVSVQTATLLQASYRGMQDMRTAVRFFRKTFVEDGNPYGVDTSKIVCGGVGTGGYCAMGAAFLDDLAKLDIPKFFDFAENRPYVVDSIHGNVEGTNETVFNKPNHVGYSSEFNMVFNMGGAAGDSNWLDPGDMPVVGFHTTQDPNAPYDIGIVIVPTTGNTVIDQAAGSRRILQIANEFGNNDIFKNAGFNDPFTDAANKNNEGFEGLFPFDRPLEPGELNCGFGVTLPLVAEGDPWSWWDGPQFVKDWDAATGGEPFPGFVANCNQLTAQPDMSAEKSRTHIDTVMGYLAPRMAVVLNLGATSNIDQQLKQELGFKLYPNPAQDLFTIEAVEPAQAIELRDMTGRIIRREASIRSNQYEIERGNLAPGVYILRVDFRQGSVTQQVVIQ